MTIRGAWFGRLLRWHRDHDTWRTTYLGCSHELVKVTRAYADAVGGGCRPGWNFAVHPDWRPHDGPPPHVIGPGLGRRIDQAKTTAEVWILAGGADRQPRDDGPNLVTVMGAGGAGFGPAAGRTLIAYPDRAGRCITVHADSARPHQRGELVGTLTPTFVVPGEAEPIRITWTPRVGEAELPVCGSWREACSMFSEEIKRGT